MALNGRSKPLVRWIIRPAAGAGLGLDPMGIVVTHGADYAYAELVATKRWRISKSQLVAMRWDDCDPVTRHQAAVAERDEAARLVGECVEPARAAVGVGWRDAIAAEQRQR